MYCREHLGFPSEGDRLVLEAAGRPVQLERSCWGLLPPELVALVYKHIGLRERKLGTSLHLRANHKRT